MTPLLSAIYEGHVDCVRLLLQKVRSVESFIYHLSIFQSSKFTVSSSLIFEFLQKYQINLCHYLLA